MKRSARVRDQSGPLFESVMVRAIRLKALKSGDGGDALSTLVPPPFRTDELLSMAHACQRGNHGVCARVRLRGACRRSMSSLPSCLGRANLGPWMIAPLAPARAPPAPVKHVYLLSSMPVTCVSSLCCIASHVLLTLVLSGVEPVPPCQPHLGLDSPVLELVPHRRSCFVGVVDVNSLVTIKFPWM